MKNIFTALLLAIAFFLSTAIPVSAQSNSVNIYFFWGQGCPHCANEKPFLSRLERTNPKVEVYDYEVWGNSQNRKYLAEVGKKLNIDISGVPLTIVGDEAFVGFNESLTSKAIEERVKYCSANICDDSVAEIVGVESSSNYTIETATDSQKKAIPEKISLPILGEVATKNFSLPMFTIVLGALDGFNPCAMWTLLFLISLLLGMKDKKRRWILGTSFIVTSALVYFLFIAAWLNLILFLGFIVWIRVLIGLVAIAGGGYSLREYFVNKDSGCKVTGDEKRQAVFEKLKEITHEKKFALALIGIILLAFAVNLVELICSAGLPVIFTQVLALSELTRLQYFSYMLLYIFVFLVDDLFVFFTAMITLEMTGISTKYTRTSHLIGGALMVIIGLLLLFKPEYLMFG